MAKQPDRVCPECGSDRWKAREATRQWEAAYRLRQEAEKIARENGLLRFRGTRGFVTIPSEHQGPTDGIESFTVCKAGPACRKRRKEASYPGD